MNKRLFTVGVVVAAGLAAAVAGDASGPGPIQCDGPRHVPRRRVEFCLWHQCQRAGGGRGRGPCRLRQPLRLPV